MLALFQLVDRLRQEISRQATIPDTLQRIPLTLKESHRPDRHSDQRNDRQKDDNDNPSWCLLLKIGSQNELTTVRTLLSLIMNFLTAMRTGNYVIKFVIHFKSRCKTLSTAEQSGRTEMHSIKNTVVAVCLLGLSFLFYQASSKNDTDQSNLIPALDISDGLDGVQDFAAQGIDSLKSKMPNMELPNMELPNVELPNLDQAKNMASEAASKMANRIGEKASELKDKIGFNGFANNSTNSMTPNAFAPAPSNQRSNPGVNAQQNLSFAHTTPPTNSFGANSFAANQPNINQPVTREPIDDRVARDQGLIAALDNQFAANKKSFSGQPAINQPAINQPAMNQPVMNQPTINPPAVNQSPAQIQPPMNSAGQNEFQFTSQPIPSSDSSFNRLASENRAINESDDDSDFNIQLAAPDTFSPDTPESNTLSPNLSAPSGFASGSPVTLSQVWPQIDKLVEAQKFRDALALLSKHYHTENLSGPHRQKLIGWLDALAGKVIFSAEHHLTEFPYTVSNESLADISQRWKVPPQLIYNINRAKIPNPAVLSGGTELKEVKGPFNAEIDLSEKVMTLFLGNLYAGRYAIRVGVSGTPKPGLFRVLIKSAKGHDWRDASGKDYPPGSPSNGYGPNWIGLSGSLCIHAVSDSATDGHPGCIGLSDKDSRDVFGILTDSSTIKIVQ